MTTFRTAPLTTVVVLGFVCLTALSASAQSFTEVVPGLPKSAQLCVAWGDYDGDGLSDVLVAGLGSHDIPFTTLYHNNGNGTFVNSGIVLQGLSRANAAWGDFDGDGKLDLAMTGLDVNGLPTTRVYRNDGNTFTAVSGNFTGVFAGIGAQSIAWGDYDGDGDLDLLIIGTASAGQVATPITRLYRNDHGTFTSVPHPFPNIFVGALAWGDYDNDGRLDVVIAGSVANGGFVTTVWHNDGAGNFTDAGANLPGMDLCTVAWGDYDNDGDLDLLIAGNSFDGWITRIYRNDGGTFVDANANLLGLIWSTAAWGDYDNDGNLDLMIVGYDPVGAERRSILYRNSGGGFVDSGSTFHNVYLGAVSWVDYDNDGRLDLSIAGNDINAEIFSLYHNNIATANTPPGVPGNTAVDVLGTSVRFSWSAANDFETPAAALTYNLRVGTTPGGSQIIAPNSSASGIRQLAEMGNAQLGLTAGLTGLVPGTTYYWSVQSVDTGFVGSPFAAEGSFVALADPPQNVSFTRAADGTIHGIWRGTPGSAYRIEVSPDLKTWSPATLVNAAAGTGVIDYMETPAADVTKRFYRAAQP